MPPSILQFRLLVLEGLLIGVFGTVHDLLMPEFVPPEVHAHLESLQDGFSLLNSVVFVILGLVIMALGIAATIGLCVFERWARPMAVVSTMLSLVLYPMSGPMLFSGVGALCFDVSIMLWGAVLAASYWSPLAERFERRG